MDRFWFRWWLTLTLLVSGALPAPFLNLDPPEHRVPNASKLSSPGPGAGSAEFRLSELVAFLRAPNLAKDSDGHGPVFKKGARRDGDGAPPKDRQAWLTCGPAGPGPYAEACDSTSQPRRLFRASALQGMQPEQGGQTGPPEDAASLS